MKLNNIFKALISTFVFLLFLVNVKAMLADENACLPTQPPPACSASCVVGGLPCPQNCSVCTLGASGYICKPPPAAPICGDDCTADANKCVNIAGCNQCLPKPNGQAGKSCQAAPTSTPVPTSTTIPSPTPNPFNEAMCKCNDIDYEDIVAGKTVKITAHGKVVGSDTNYARIPFFTFSFYESVGAATGGTILEGPTRIDTTLVASAPPEDKYDAVWNLNIPADVGSSKTYRIQAAPSCVKKVAAAFYNTNRVVLGTETKQLSFWDKIVSFFANLFGTNQETNQATSTSVAPTQTNQEEQGLQMKQIRPAINVTKEKDRNNCTFIQFNFPN